MSENQKEQEEEIFKLRDHVALLQFSFQDLLLVMTDTIGRISRDAAIDPEANVGYPLFKYEEIPNTAEEIVSKSLLIDALIDEAKETTFLDKSPTEIFQTLKELSDTYEEKVQNLDSELEEADVWMGKIHQVIDVVSKNTPWLSQTREDDDDDEQEESESE